jgi:parallel beta-helix repeat protein
MPRVSSLVKVGRGLSLVLVLVATLALSDGIVASANRLHDSLLLNNMTSDNGRDGIVLHLSNSGNVLRGNVAEPNGEYGIYVQGAVANLFEATGCSATASSTPATKTGPRTRGAETPA